MNAFIAHSEDRLGIIHAHKWLLSRLTGLFCLKRGDIIYDIVVSNCFFPMLISWVLRKSTKHSTNLSKKDKYDKDNLKAVFGLLELLVYIQPATCILLSCNAQVSYSGFHYLPISSKIFDNMLHLIFSMKFTFSARKCH